MYIKISIGDKDVAVFGAQRQEILGKKRADYTYYCYRYEPTIAGLEGFKKGRKFKIIKHKYSDKAEVLAEKVLKAFNK